MNKSKTIGIIGGQGPLSTADMYMRIIAYYQNVLGLKEIEDFPPMIIFSVPTPDLISGVKNEQVTFNATADAVKKLERDGSDFIIIACNSLQFLNERLQALVNIPIISIAGVVSDHVKDLGYKTVGILATYTTINKHIYDEYLDKLGVKLVKPDPDDQKIVEQVILNEQGGAINQEDKRKLLTIMEKLQRNGAESILLACTELPVLINQIDSNIPMVDCNELYAVEAAKLSYEQ